MHFNNLRIKHFYKRQTKKKHEVVDGQIFFDEGINVVLLFKRDFIGLTIFRYSYSYTFQG